MKCRWQFPTNSDWMMQPVCGVVVTWHNTRVYDVASMFTSDSTQNLFFLKTYTKAFFFAAFQTTLLESQVVDLGRKSKEECHRPPGLGKIA